MTVYVGLQASEVILGQRLFQNQFCETSRGVILSTNQPVVVKRFKNLLSSSKVDATVLLDRVDKLRSLPRHASLVPYHGGFTDPESGSVSLIRGFAEGSDLLEIMPEDGFRVDKVKQVGSQLCDCVQFLQTNGIPIGRELEGHNIFMKEDGSVLLADYGLDLFSTAVSLEGFSGGYAGEKQEDKKVVRLLGRLLWRLLTGSEDGFEQGRVEFIKDQSMKGLMMLLLSPIPGEPISLPRLRQLLSQPGDQLGTGKMRPFIIMWLNSIKKEEVRTQTKGILFSTASLDNSPIPGIGGFGIVFKIQLDGKDYALKAPKKPNMIDGQFTEDNMHVKMELELMQPLVHTNIISIQDLIYIALDRSDYQFCCFVMELADRSLVDEYARWEIMTYKESYILGISYARGILKGLSYLHSKNVVHRDLKIENILIVGKEAKITDFGLSKEIEREDQTLSDIRGSDHWFSPEYFDGLVLNQKAADVFALGTIFWSMRTRKYPFDGMNGVEVSRVYSRNEYLPIPQKCPNHILTVIQRAWSFDPDERPRVHELIKVLDEYEEIHPCTSVSVEESMEIWGETEAFEIQYSKFIAANARKK